MANFLASLILKQNDRFTRSFLSRFIKYTILDQLLVVTSKAETAFSCIQKRTAT